MRYFLFNLFFCVHLIGLTQTNPKDSLQRVLKVTKNTDTTYCSVLNALIDLEQDDKLWPSYNNEVIEIAENQLKKINNKSPYYLYYMRTLAGALNNLGYLKKFQGDVPSALSYYHKSLKLYEQVNDKTNASAIQNNLGFIYKDQGEIKKALDCFLKNLTLFRKNHDTANISLTLNNIGIIYIESDQFDKALKCYQECLALQEKIKNQKVKAYALNNIGFVYQKQYNSKSTKNKKDSLLYFALEYFNKSLAIREVINDKRGISISLQNIAETLLAQDKTQEAQKSAENSLKIAQEIGYPDNVKRASNILSKIYSKTGNWKGAFEMQVLFKQMSDSLTNENNRKLSIQKGFQIEYEKKAAADSVKVAEDKKVVQAQLKQERTQRFALYGGLVLVALFGVFMFNRFKITQKQNILIHKQKAELQIQKELVEEHQKETLDSIHYAKRIQSALIANSDFITEYIPNNFIYFNPKDIVSGDFYWASHHNDKFYLAACDSTGHGVPGAFMSLLNMGFLSEAIKEKNIEKPNEVFNYVRERLMATISDEGQKDGMDGILICIDKKHHIIEYAAANNEPILIRKHQIIELPKDKMPVGKGERNSPFTLHSVELNPGDTLYLYTDGFADQFGGAKGKKFKYKQLNEFLLSINSQDLSEQKSQLEKTFIGWKGDLEQVDDVLVIGIKI